MADLESAKKTHPLNIHFEETHQGKEQKILIRVVATPKTALERQIWESVAIDRLSGHSPNACLNLKSEWGHSRTPALVNKENKRVARKN